MNRIDPIFGPLKRSVLHPVGTALLNALFPRRCAGCEQFRTPPRELGALVKGVSAVLKPVQGNKSLEPAFVDPPREDGPEGAARVVANWFCPACRHAFTWVTSPYCTVCGRMFPGRTGRDHSCAACSRTPPKYDQARAVGVYEGSLKTVIQKFKYRGQMEWADPLGLLLYLAAREHGVLNNCDVLLPVPLHPSRLRQRGFNQSYLMLRKWPRYARLFDSAGGLPFIDPWLLRRRRPTAPQTGLAPKARRANVQGAFQIVDPQGVLKGRQVLLVDDVFTTGATASACVQALKSEGQAVGVCVLTLANTA